MAQYMMGFDAPDSDFRVLAYQAYVRSNKYQERYQSKSLRILTLTTTIARLENLKRTTEKAGGDHMVRASKQKNIEVAAICDPDQTRMRSWSATLDAALADADFCLLQWHFLDERGDELRREALAASEEALRLDPSLAEAHVARANLMSLAGRPAEAEEEFRRATTLNPGLASAWYFQGRFFLAAGRMAEGALALEEAARCDPEDYNAVTLLPQAYRALGDRAREASAVQRAAVVSDRWARLNPDDVRALYCAGGNMVRSGEVERGLALVERALQLEPDDFGVLYNSACTYATAGDTDRAIGLLDRALQTGGGYRSWIEHDSDLEPLRRDPRFKAILARLPP